MKIEDRLKFINDIKEKIGVELQYDEHMDICDFQFTLGVELRRKSPCRDITRHNIENNFEDDFMLTLCSLIMDLDLVSTWLKEYLRWE